VDWYRGSEVCTLVLRYYFLLRAVLRTKPFLRRCLARCRHCRIFFLTHPRNAGRKNLRCPFGCREAYRKQSSTTRSVAYWRDCDHKEKKRALNGKRKTRRAPRVRAPTHLPNHSGAKTNAAKANSLVIEYVRMVISLIEGRRISRRQVLRMLEKVVRQHTMSRRRKVDHAVAWLNEEPP
jgi:hypothetical protein